MNQYVHHVPGRLRVRIPSIKGNLAEASSLEKRIRAQRGVKNVQTSPLTGSVLVHYDPETAGVSTLSQIVLCLAATEPFSRALPTTPHTAANRRTGQQIATRVAAAVVRRVMEVAVERAAVTLIAALL
jgi:Heavy metal associated domain 2